MTNEATISCYGEHGNIYNIALIILDPNNILEDSEIFGNTFEKRWFNRKIGNNFEPMSDSKIRKTTQEIIQLCKKHQVQQAYFIPEIIETSEIKERRLKLFPSYPIIIPSLLDDKTTKEDVLTISLKDHKDLQQKILGLIEREDYDGECLQLPCSLALWHGGQTPDKYSDGAEILAIACKHDNLNLVEALNKIAREYYNHSNSDNDSLKFNVVEGKFKEIYKYEHIIAWGAACKKATQIGMCTPQICPISQKWKKDWYQNQKKLEEKKRKKQRYRKKRWKKYKGWNRTKHLRPWQRTPATRWVIRKHRKKP